MTTIDEVLDRIRSDSANSYELGSRFERLMLAFFRLDRTYAGQFTDVWLWSDWPGNEGKVDTGIDLVAKNAHDDGYTAIQCKCYDANTVLTKSDIDSFFTASGKAPFTNRIIVATTSNWSKHAEDALKGQEKPVQRIGLEALEESTVHWDRWDPDHPDSLTLRGRKSVRPHQVEAIEAVRKGFATSDRGKLIMACGTGKTFTAQRIAEETAGPGGHVLVLVPSISLLSQTLKEWTADASIPIAPYAICSDSKAGHKGSEEDISPYDLILPATTDPELIVAQYRRQDADNPMSVFFSTYQSLPVITAAQVAGIPEFDLLIADEAHRTTGVTLDGSEDSNFVKVHDNVRIAAKKRLYMTATPRVYSDAAKGKAATADAYVASMDDETIYGPEFHRLGFHEAVQRDLLTDYKVLILAVDEAAVSRAFQRQLSDENNELKLDDATRIVGCINALAKRDILGDAFDYDPEPMQRAVAFSNTIAKSKKFKALFNEIASQWNSTVDPNGRFTTEVEHVDGTFNALQREQLLRWLKAEPPEETCHILSNARCLTEGVDVPALDAILFLEPRNSMVDVVQAVGRVMRKAGADKKYGYVVLPVGIPADQTPEQALNDNKRFKAVWQVLNALRSHDDRLNAIINKLELNKQPPDIIDIVPVPGPQDEDDSDPAPADDTAKPSQLQLGYPIDELRDGIYAKLVLKVGTRHYWEDWANDVAAIAQRHRTRITALVEDANLDLGDRFNQFVEGLRGIINDSITEDDAITMLSQHLITKPVFEALFTDFAFLESNPVSMVMQKMVELLDEHALEQETDSLEGFYDSVRLRVEGIDNAAGKQRIITELYEGFFSKAFPKTADALGIVYTPVELVDFVLYAADHALRRHFDGTSLTDEGVNIIDPFCGTGTFIVRLLQSGLIKPEDLARKYNSELHSNDILLLAYYIAAVNIESSYHDLANATDEIGDGYSPFTGLVLTDTFHLGELDAGSGRWDVFPVNNERATRQQQLGIRVIVGNPPYSVGQKSENDDNKNLAYPRLDAQIAKTYVARSTAKNHRSLYDSYVRAFRWSSDRVLSSADGGVIAFVTNGGFIDAKTFDGFRKTLSSEFHHIYCYNLRGNQRTAGIASQQEGGKVFGAGSRATVAITILVKEPGEVPESGAVIHYRDVGDYLSREQKLGVVSSAVTAALLDEVDWTTIVPDERGDWVNLRSASFEALYPVVGKSAEGRDAAFRSFSNGLKTNRDAWNFNSSRVVVEANANRMVQFLNEQTELFSRTAIPAGTRGADVEHLVRDVVDKDPTKFSWETATFQAVGRGRRFETSKDDIRLAVYRPFFRQFVNFSKDLCSRRYQLPRFFPEPTSENPSIVVSGIASPAPFSALMVRDIPCLNLTGAGNTSQVFPLYSPHEGTTPKEDTQRELFEPQDARRLNLSSDVIDDFSSAVGNVINGEQIFHYIYGILHSPHYRERFAADLKKASPRIPLPGSGEQFAAFEQAGRRLADLHLNYEHVEPWPDLSVEFAAGWDPSAPNAYRVEKMRDARADGSVDRSTLILNRNITVSNIPMEAHDYVLGSRSALDWLIDRYQITTHKESGITNDPNDWATEHGDPTYILDLVRRIVTVSMKTLDEMRALPEPNLGK